MSPSAGIPHRAPIMVVYRDLLRDFLHIELFRIFFLDVVGFQSYIDQKGSRTLRV